MRIFALILCLLSSAVCVAQGTCPAGLPVTGTHCYFVADSGLDTNTGVDETHPWLHSPGMHNCSNTCGGVTLSPGIGIIFRGGDTWHFGNSSATPYAGVVSGCAINGTQAAGLCIDDINGTITHPIYYGVDSSWFTGSSWTRPILTADNSLCNSSTTGTLPDGATCTTTTDSYGQPSDYVSACGFQVGTANNLVDIGFSQYIDFDNFELTGLCQSHVGQPGGEDSYIYYGSAQAPISMTNLYIHGASHLHWAALNGSVGCTGSTVCINLTTFYGSVNNGSIGETIHNNVVDFADSDPVGENLCQCGFYDVAYNEFNNTTQFISQSGTGLHDFHDNIYENFYENGHSNLDEDEESSTIAVYYNNVYRHIEKFVSSGGGVFLWPGPTGSGDTAYIFNNVAYDVGALEYLNLGGLGITTNNGAYKIFNNTWQTNVNQPVLRCGSPVGTVLDTNNHIIDDGSYKLGACMTSLTVTSMTNATATSDGYTSSQTFAYSPTTAGSPTVGSGTNEYSGYCSTLLGSADALIQAAGTACRNGTTYACAYNATSHTMTCPAQMATARPTSAAWDTGGYQLAAGSIGSFLSTGVTLTTGTVIQ